MDTTKPLPNNMMLFMLTQLESTLGKNGLTTVLKYSGLDRLIDNYPPRDFNPGEPFDTFATIIINLMELYGENGYRAVVRGVGVQTFDEMRKDLPWFFEVENGALDDLSPPERFGVMYSSYIEKASQVFGTTADLTIKPNQIIDITTDSVWCVGLTAQKPICIFTLDFYTGMARWMGVEEISVVETHCRAAGDDVCRFVSTFR